MNVLETLPSGVDGGNPQSQFKLERINYRLDIQEARDFFKGVLGRQPTDAELNGSLNLTSLIPMLRAVVTEVVSKFLNENKAVATPAPEVAPKQFTFQAEPAKENTI